jgi:hypothetical protein
MSHKTLAINKEKDRMNEDNNNEIEIRGMIQICL